MSIEQMARRQALSALVWDKGRWRDGRNVIAAPLQVDMAMAGPTCRVMPATRRYDRGPEPFEEAIVMTWEELAIFMLGEVPIFGLLDTAPSASLGRGEED
jgi:hypothetical protein